MRRDRTRWARFLRPFLSDFQEKFFRPWYFAESLSTKQNPFTLPRNHLDSTNILRKKLSLLPGFGFIRSKKSEVVRKHLGSYWILAPVRDAETFFGSSFWIQMIDFSNENLTDQRESFRVLAKRLSWKKFLHEQKIKRMFCFHIWIWILLTLWMVMWNCISIGLDAYSLFCWS